MRNPTDLIVEVIVSVILFSRVIVKGMLASLVAEILSSDEIMALCTRNATASSVSLIAPELEDRVANSSGLGGLLPGS